jgi:hypothetical protein
VVHLEYFQGCLFAGVLKLARVSRFFVVSGAIMFLALAGPGLSPRSFASPAVNPEEQGFFQQIYQVGHPNVSASQLLKLGYQTCDIRLGGGSTDDAKASLFRVLDTQGLFSSNAEVGTLVHVAINTLCPEVGYP